MGLALTASTRVILIVLAAYTGGLSSYYVDGKVAVGLLGLVIGLFALVAQSQRKQQASNAKNTSILRGVSKRHRSTADLKVQYHKKNPSEGDQLLRGVQAKDAWRKDVNSDVVSEAWFSFAGHIVQEFIYDTWYSHLTPDKEFPAEVRALLNGAFGRLAKRARTHLHLHQLCCDLVDMLIDQIDIFRDAKQALLSEMNVDWDENVPQLDERTEEMLRRMLARDSNLHPGFENPKAHYAVLKHMSDSVISMLADPVYSNRVLSRVVSREMLSACVLRKVLEQCSPYRFQKWMNGLLTLLTRRGDGLMCEDDVARPSSELRGVWNQTTKVLQTVALEEKVVEGNGSSDDDDAQESTGGFLRPHTILETIRRISSPAEYNRQQSSGGGKFKGKPSAHVSSAEISSNEARDFVVYRIRVGDDRGEWTVSRRYRHFESLHRTIRATKGYTLSLPGKRLFGHGFSPEYIESRRRALDDYVVKLLQNPDLCSLDAVWEFFRKRSERFQIQSQSKSFLSDTVKRTVVGMTRDACHAARTQAKSAASAFDRGKRKSKKKDQSTGQVAIQLNIRIDDEGEQSPSPCLHDDSDAESSTSTPQQLSISAPLCDLVNCVFSLETRGFFTRQIFQISKQFLLLVFGDTVNEYLNSRITMLQQESTIAKIIAQLQSFLWPGGKFVRKNGIVEPATEEKYVSLAEPGDDFEEIRASLREQLSSGAPVTVSKIVGRMAYFEGTRDIMQLLQSSTMTMQIGYGFLELILAHLFPEIKHKLS
ncbi:hypothetical protein M9435_002684 [Picochlorum sp. BPE23]|nr:hypothetical protein M9435_002684 [Picochlorum sp. BPE23]